MTVLVRLFAESFNQAAINPLCSRLHRAIVHRLKIADRQGAHRARLGAPNAGINGRRLTAYRLLVCFHELARPWQAGSRHFLETSATEIESRFPMSVDEAVATRFCAGRSQPTSRLSSRPSSTSSST